MKTSVLILCAVVVLAACDDTRLYEKNFDFEQSVWMMKDTPEFEFTIEDTTQSYNIYCNVRNSLEYPFSRLFLTYYLQDSLGRVQEQKLVSEMIFDPGTGKPEGTSGLGDIYDHQFMLLPAYKFSARGAHKIRLEQFMRKDSLPGILAVGIRVEKNF